MKLAAWIAVLVVLSWAIVACIVEHETKKRRHNYRPTHDNRFPHRDEFKAFMRDCK